MDPEQGQSAGQHKRKELAVRNEKQTQRARAEPISSGETGSRSEDERSSDDPEPG
jgi:hypothetical protein